MDVQQVDPGNVIVDAILRFSATMPQLGYAAVLNGTLVFATRNHQDTYVTLSVPVNLDGAPFEGNATTPPRWVLFKLGPTVWKVSPSVSHPLFHAYLTIVGVPEPAPWEKR